MLPLVGDLNWFKDVALPCLLTFLCTWALSSSGRLLRFTRSRAARRRAQKEINRSLITVTADFQGGIAPFLLMQVTHLIARCTLFLTALIATTTSFLVLYMDKASASGGAVVALAVITGVSAKMAHTVLHDVGELVLAQTSPTSFISKVEKRLGPIYVAEFAEDLKRLKGLAEQVELARKGRNSAEMLAGMLISEHKEQPQQPTSH